MKMKNFNFTTTNQIKALLDLQRKLNLDVVFTRMELDEYMKIFSNPLLNKKYLKKREDWLNLNVEDIIKMPKPEKIRDSTSFQVLKSIKSKKGKLFKFIGGYIPAPYSLISLILDLQITSELVIYNPEFLHSLIERARRAIIQYAEEINEFVDLFNILAPSECTILKRSYINLVSRAMNELIHDFVYELEIPTFVHFCSLKNKQVVNKEILKPMKDAGLVALNIPNILENIELAKNLDLILFGGIDPTHIQQKTKDEILREIKKVLINTQNIKFILGTNCQVKWTPNQIKSDKLLDLLTKIRKLV